MSNSDFKGQYIKKIFLSFFYVLVASGFVLECDARDDPDIQADYDSPMEPLLPSGVRASKLISSETMVEHLSAGMDECCKIGIIEVFGNIRPDRLTANFEALVSRLSSGMNGHHRIKVIEVLGSIPSGRLTPEFEAIVERVSAGMNGCCKKDVIEVLARINPDLLSSDFETIVDHLSAGMNSHNKRKVVCALGRVSPDRLTSNFETIVERLSSGMNGCCKKDVIDLFGKIDLDELTTINKELTDGIVSRLQKFLSADERVTLLRRLSGRETTQNKHDDVADEIHDTLQGDGRNSSHELVDNVPKTESLFESCL